MNIYELFPSKWVRAADLEGKNVTVVVRGLVIENIGQPPKNEDKPVLYFQKTEKGMVLNKTNAMIISSIYGPETDNWMGKPITLYPTRVKAFGAIHDVIRVRDHVQTISAAPDPIVEVDDEVLVDDDPDPVAAPPDADNPFEPEPPTEAMRKSFHALGSEVYAAEWDNQRPKLVEAVTAGAETSSKKLTATEMQKLIDGMKKKRAQQQAKAAQEAA